MTPKSKFFQASFSATLLQSAALSSALLLAVSPAHAETLTLVCENDRGGSLTLLINFDQKTVGLPSDNSASSCTWDIEGRKLVVPNCNPPGPAQISERSITWERNIKIVTGDGGIHDQKVTGSLDRLTGSVFMQKTGSADTFGGKCRRATQKF